MTASALLGIGKVTYQPIRPMAPLKGNSETYRYFGIANGFALRMCQKIFKDTTIRVIANVDGLPLFRNSKQEFWPILVRVFHRELQCKPFLVALRVGDSKPASANDYLEDFVSEVEYLTINGLTISSTNYNFELIAIAADTPARAFLKACKGHTGFYACERCETRGISVLVDKKSVKKNPANEQRQKRIYPEINAKRKTAQSFAEQAIPEHHLPGVISPLLRIPNFDIIHGVILDTFFA